MQNSTAIPRREFVKKGGLVLMSLSLPFNLAGILNYTNMKNKIDFDVIIIGGSFSGLSAAMALGRALKKVLIIDSGKPCNRQTPHSHNVLTQDGKTPADITAVAKQQVEKYETIQFFNGLAVTGVKTNIGFEIKVSSGEFFGAKKLIFATGIKDLLPPIEGLTNCWGISVLHCPFCHGYEVKNEKTAILGNGENGFGLAKLISNWTKELTLITNGPSTLTAEQTRKLESHNIKIVEKEIEKVEHSEGYLKNIVFKDSTISLMKAIYTRPPFEQHSVIPENMGCEFTSEGYIKVDENQNTTVKGIFACGDNSTPIRKLTNALAKGTIVGMTVTKELIFENF